MATSCSECIFFIFPYLGAVSKLWYNTDTIIKVEQGKSPIFNTTVPQVPLKPQL